MAKTVMKKYILAGIHASLRLIPSTILYKNIILYFYNLDFYNLDFYNLDFYNLDFII
jgi:hypothetical protein